MWHASGAGGVNNTPHVSGFYSPNLGPLAGRAGFTILAFVAGAGLSHVCHIMFPWPPAPTFAFSCAERCPHATHLQPFWFHCREWHRKQRVLSHVVFRLPLASGIRDPLLQRPFPHRTLSLVPPCRCRFPPAHAVQDPCGPDELALQHRSPLSGRGRASPSGTGAQTPILT
jgi:hypothetical protein